MPGAGIGSQSSAPARRLLTKTLFKTAVQCPRKLRYALSPQQLYPRNNEASSLLASLSEDGRKFEQYCRLRCFGDGGIEIGGSPAIRNATSRGLEFDASSSSGDDGRNINDAVIDDLVEQTRYYLLHDGPPPADATTHHAAATTTLFEAAVRHENFFIRADVLRKHHDTNALSLIEIKAKSWDSAKVAKGDNPMVGRRGGIKSTFLPYIHDVAFQKMVIEGAYPEYGRVQAYLMMPDKSKRTLMSNLNGLVENAMRGDAEALEQMSVQAMDDEDLSALVDVTQLTEDVINGELKFPGSTGESFVEFAERWGAYANTPSGQEQPWHNNPPTIGSHCKSCEYRLKSGSDKEDRTVYSGFNACWEEVTALEPEAFRPGAAVIDLWNGSKKDVTRFIASGKYRLSDLTNEDLGFTDEGVEIEKGKKQTNGFSRPRRQLFQANGIWPSSIDGRRGSSSTDTEDERSLSKLTIPKLKDRLRSLKLKVGGRKAELIARLLKHRHYASSPVSPTCERRVPTNPISGDEGASAPPYILDAKYLRDEMNRWRYPYHFIDFETAMPALPNFAGHRPFETIAFQFSHHILHEDGRVVEHASQFLHAEPGICPNDAFLCALANAIGDCSGSVFRWGIHENTVVASLLDAFEGPGDVSDKLRPLLLGGDRAMIDLMKTAAHGYFVPGSDGSSSIKRLLSPTLKSSDVLERLYGSQAYSSSNFTDVQWFQRVNGGGDNVRDPYDILVEYDKMNGTAQKSQSDTTLVVAEGGAAIAAYSALQQSNDKLSPEERSAIKASLLRYCELDTLAMAMIVQAWQEFLHVDK